MRTRHRRKLLCELWRVKERLRSGIETEGNIVRLSYRQAWLIEKLGGERPWGVRAPTAFPDGRIGEKGASQGIHDGYRSPLGATDVSMHGPGVSLKNGCTTSKARWDQGPHAPPALDEVAP